MLGVVVTGVVAAGAETEVDAVVLVEFRCVVAPLRRDAAGVEQPAAESATPTNTVSAQTANHFLILCPLRTSTRSRRVPVDGTENQLASWTTSASPTPA